MEKNIKTMGTKYLVILSARACMGILDD